MSLTESQLKEIADTLDIDVADIPTGKLHTSGNGFDQIKEHTEIAVKSGDLEPSVKCVALIDRDVYGVDENGPQGIEFTAVLTDDRGFVGLADGRGLSWFTPAQVESLKQAIALIENQ